MSFLQACARGDKRLVCLTIDTSLLNPGLLQACRGGYTEVAALLILYGATDLDGGLEEACRFAQLGMIEFLLAEGCSDLNTALVTAAEYDHLSVMELLIQHGADNLSQAFACACKYNSLAVVKWLSPQVEDLSEGLNTACQNGKAAVVKHLLSLKVVIEGETFIQACAGCVEVVEMIFPYLSLKTIELLNSGLLQAASHGRVKIVRHLALLGANAWELAFHFACEGNLDIETLVELISRGATNLKKVPDYLVPVLLNRGVDPALFMKRALSHRQARESRQALTRQALLDFSGLSEDCLDEVLLKYLNYE